MVDVNEKAPARETRDGLGEYLQRATEELICRAGLDVCALDIALLRGEAPKKEERK